MSVLCLQIMGDVRELDYKSGKCFTGAGVDTSDTGEVMVIFFFFFFFFAPLALVK